MKTLLRVAAFAAVAFTVHATQTWWLARIKPDISTSYAIRQHKAPLSEIIEVLNERFGTDFPDVDRLFPSRSNRRR